MAVFSGSGLLFLVLLWLVAGVVAFVLAGRKGRGDGGFVLLAVVAAPLALIVALAMAPGQAETERRGLSAGEFRHCPLCAEVIRRDARVCRYCGNHLPQEASAPPAIESAADEEFHERAVDNGFRLRDHPVPMIITGCLALALIIGVLLGMHERPTLEHEAHVGGHRVKARPARATEPSPSPLPGVSSSASLSPLPGAGASTDIEDEEEFAWSKAAEPSPGPASDDSARGRAVRAFTAEYFRETKQGSLPWMASHYTDVVNFFGTKTARSDVLKQKADFIRRWPGRDYQIETSSISVQCEAAGPNCYVSGVVDWNLSSLERNIIFDGKADFYLRLIENNGQYSIAGESGKNMYRAGF